MSGADIARFISAGTLFLFALRLSKLHFGMRLGDALNRLPRTSLNSGSFVGSDLVMSNPPDKPHSPDPKYTAFFSNYGGFLAGWAFFDLMIEILIKKELNLPSRENSIVCASIGFGAKVNILLALLARNSTNAEGIRLIRHTQQVAERNSFAHGFFAMAAPGEGMRLIKREVKEARYIVKSKPLKISSHMGQFLEAFMATQTFFKVTDDEIDTYGKEIEADAKGHQGQD